MSIQCSDLESGVMDLLLRGDNHVLATLREQFQGSTLASRELTGVGFYCTFTVPDGSGRLPGRPDFAFGDVNAHMDGLCHGAGFVLYVRQGAIDCLEGYTYDEPWPEGPRRFTLEYSTGSDRDYDALLKKLPTGSRPVE